MKAVIILNIHDDKYINCIDELRANIDVNLYGDKVLHYNNMTLKPMPTTEAIPIEWLESYIENSFPIKEHLPYWYKRNWNNRLRMMIDDWRKENEKRY